MTKVQAELDETKIILVKYLPKLFNWDNEIWAHLDFIIIIYIFECTIIVNMISKGLFEEIT